MKSDLDRLMAARDLDAFFLLGGETENPYRKYLLNGADCGGAVIKVRGQAPVVIAAGMESEEAAKSGLQVLTYEGDFNSHDLWEISDVDERTVTFYRRMFDHFGIERGRLGIYGFGEIGGAWELLKLLDARFPEIEFVGERMHKIFDEAVMTKDPDEVAVMRDVADRTNAVMLAAWNFIAAHRAEGDTVVTLDGTPLTIGAVKAFVRRELMAHGLEDPIGMIFAQGRDGGVPHSTGEDGDPLRLGQAIVFDLFPRDLRSGYYHDMTRTWCVGHAPEAVQRAYEHTLTVFNGVVDALKVGELVGQYNLMNFDMMEEFGYETPRSHPGTQVGAMTWALGHGVGLEVHERPYITQVDNEKTQERIQVGNVLTVEPGVYYPDRGYGVRIEDTLYINPQGKPESLSTMHKDLVIPLEG